MYKDEYLYEIENIKNKKKQELKEKAKLIRATENIILQPLLNANNMTKTLYKSIISQVKTNRSNNTCWDAIQLDNGMFYVLRNNIKIYFNFVLDKNNNIIIYNKNKDYIAVRKYDIYTTADNKQIY